MIISIDDVIGKKKAHETALRRERLKLRHIAIYELDNPDYSDREKVTGIVSIANMTTYNSVSKECMIKMVRYLLDFIVDGEGRDKK